MPRDRMKAQRKRYDKAGFVRAESIIPKHRLPLLRKLTAQWRALARGDLDNDRLLPGERVRYAGAAPYVMFAGLTIHPGDAGTVAGKLGSLLHIDLDNYEGPHVATGPRNWERIK